MDWATMKDVAVLVGSVVGLLTLIKGVMEYSKNNAMKRAEYFAQLHRQLNEVVVLSRICDLLDTDSPDLGTMSYAQKYHFLSFFESVALMSNAGLLRKDLAHYMFSYYAIRCYNSTNFWTGLKRDSVYWTLFGSFARKMTALEEKAQTNQSRLEKLRF